ncbi:MAG: hypothetical protein U5R14_04070 [Gemmatimonadota bacterium]|nr:hypothetical protein [Gemmatimonadota bacterium]
MSDRLEQTMTDDPRMDMELYEALTSLDPGERDPAYWTRFGSSVLSGAGPELARRRALASMTVGDVLIGWARALVPTAMVAVAVAGVMLMRAQGAPTSTPLGIEEMLVSDLQGITVQHISSLDGVGDPETLAAEIF